jgi:fatty-acyl-CoA synthase
MNNLSNLIGLVTRVQNRDRAVSWLPFYHDMGLVGMVLAPMASQISVDYLSPRDFAMRPRLWLKLMSQNQATISFGAALGYKLCRTTSGKLARAKARQEYINRMARTAKTVRYAGV